MSDLPAVRWLIRLLVNPGWAPLGVVALFLILAGWGLTHRYDHLLHFLGGASIAYFVVGLSASLPTLFARTPRWIVLLLVFTSSCTVAVFWEFAEFSLDRFWGTSTQLSLSETILDLALGVAGALTTLVMIAVFGGRVRGRHGISRPEDLR